VRCQPPASGRARHLLDVPVPDLLPHNGTPNAPIWSEDQAKDIGAGISEVFLDHGWHNVASAAGAHHRHLLARPISRLRGESRNRPSRWTGYPARSTGRRLIQPC